MRRVILSVVLVLGLVASAVLAQIADQRPDQRPVRQGSTTTSERPPAELDPRLRSAPMKQFDRRPEMVTVQALIVTVSFGEAEGAGGKKSPAGSLADALAEKLNGEVGEKDAPISALTTALDGVLKEKAQTASIETLTGLELATVAGQTAFVQIGHRKPRLVGTTFSQRGQTNSVNMENVGTIVQITPQVVPDGSLVVAVEIERSDLGPEAEGMVIATKEDGTEIRSPQIDTMTAKTTVAAANGQAVVVNDFVCSERQSQKETFVILRPLLVGAADDR